MAARRRRTASGSGRAGAGKPGRSGKPRKSAKTGKAEPKARGRSARPAGGRGAKAGEPGERKARPPRSVVATIPVEIGHVVHVYPKAGAAVVALQGELRAGDAVAVRGATTDFCALAERLEREGEPVETGRPGEEIGIALPHRAREGDRVFRLSR